MGVERVPYGFGSLDQNRHEERMLPSWHCHTTSTCTAIVSLPDRLQQAAPASPSYDYAHKRSQTGRCKRSACAVDCCFRSSQFKLKPAWKPGTRKPTAVLLMPSNQLSASSIQCNTSRTWLESAIRNTPVTSASRTWPPNARDRRRCSSGEIPHLHAFPRVQQACPFWTNTHLCHKHALSIHER